MEKRHNIRLTEFLLIVYILVCCQQSAAMTCRDLFRESQGTEAITAAHFPESILFMGSSSKEYPQWSAKVANEVSRMLERGEEFATVLQHIAIQRQQFDRSIHYHGVNRTESMGALRTAAYSNVKTLIYSHETKLSQPRELLYEFVLAEYYLSASKAFEIQTHYLDLSGNMLNASLLLSHARVRGVEVSGLAIRHTQISNVELIMRDVSKRIEIFQKTGDLEQFYLAMHGFFQAMPYRAGSAAIGRIFFTALYHSVTRQVLELPPEVDFFAMILSPERYINFLTTDSSSFKQSSHSGLIRRVRAFWRNF